MSAPEGWTPKWGDLVVVVSAWGSEYCHSLDGKVGRLEGVESFSRYPFHVRVPSLNPVWVHEVRPLTSEELTAHWLEHGGAG